MKPLLDMFMVDELSKNILIILSTFEFLSFDVLGKIFEEQYHELQNVISKMMVYGLFLHLAHQILLLGSITLSVIMSKEIK